MFDLQSVDLVDAFTKQLTLCKLTPGEHVVILSEPTSRPDYVAATFGAARALGAHVVAATVPAGSPSPTPSTHTGAGPGLVAVLEDTVTQSLLRNADLVVDLTREGFIHAPLQQTILDSGTRILFVCDAPEVLTRNMPGETDKADVLVSPTAPTTAFPLGSKLDDPLAMYLNDVATIPANLAGVPGISVPNGLAEDGLPTGFQVLAPARADDRVYRVGAALEALLEASWGGRLLDRAPDLEESK